ncbi:peptidoglycan-binding protein [Lachnospiraceae bacterium MD1]|uniref:Peptidoglycan-binding protein n=1 Tax=Variimorphobacter saccharofermentans TaxID=2755051 RepID=A0A839JZG5_9FIRM|nr:peptidoglycan-binding protein [Variimorphobacter saccharofermentans]MBB2182049.1 peptidoglycan-binding protein [Variimorphobacter saccharofermentans]
METQSFGRLRIRCNAPGFIPIENATVSISSPSDPTLTLERLTTDSSGLTEEIELPAPPISYSLEPSDVQPYSVYDLTISAPGHESAVYSNIEILPEIVSEQNAELNPVETDEVSEEVFVIEPHTLYADYPPKIPEDEIKPTGETGEIVLSRVVIPEFVIVHDGPPASNATNHYVRFRDYIKNVACSEIYATWPEASIYANILAILSFTLNRVYTEWYRNQGYNFTITSSTAYDHKWINGRNIFTNIGVLVDSVFTNYLSRPNVRQPILTQYCDGNRTQCPGWMTQWGSKSLGDQGYTAIQILRHYYGSSIYINTAPEVSGVPRSWPGQNLTTGSRGDSVRMIQEQLNRIAQVYSAIPKIAVDGIYGPKTAEAVRAFQRIFTLPVTGIVDLATWYKISNIYVGVTRIGV